MVQSFQETGGKAGERGLFVIVVNNVQTRLGEPENAAVLQALKRLGLSEKQVQDAYVSKTSLDARKQTDIRQVHTVIIHLFGEEQKVAQRDSSAVYKENVSFQVPKGKRPLTGPIVIAGFGPAGMFAADLLAREGMRPIVLERGGPVDKRVQAVEGFWKTGTLDPDCNVQFGEGGAGTFSDGKLTTRINDPLCGYVLERFAAHGAPAETLRKAKPHIGTDRLRGVVRSIREEILRNGGQIRFHAKLDGISVKNGVLQGISVNRQPVDAACLILAIGHSARDTFRMLAGAGVPLEGKAFSVGARIEHRQAAIDRGLYGKLAGHPSLPPGEYQLSWRNGERGVYTFCMCPGGTVVPAASELGGVVTNGMSEYRRDGDNANAALVVSVGPEDFGRGPFDGIRFQEELERKAFRMAGENYRACGATVGEFLKGRTGLKLGSVYPTYTLGVEPVDFDRLYPPQVVEMMRQGIVRFGRKLPGFAASDAVLTGPETRTSSPIRIPRQENFQSAAVRGLYPCGEGAGYAGGIMSAAVDGVRIALAILAEYTAD